MAIEHAKPGEIIDVTPYGASLATAKTSTLFKTKHVEVIRIVMSAGKEISEHEAPGEIIVQCLEGQISFTSAGKTNVLSPGQMLYLEAEAPHAVRCVAAGSFLLTILSGR